MTAGEFTMSTVLEQACGAMLDCRSAPHIRVLRSMLAYIHLGP